MAEPLLRFFVPYKTFLLGEYAVLHTGQAMLLATGPGFYYHMKQLMPEVNREAAWTSLQQHLGLSSACPVTAVWYRVCRDMPLQVEALGGNHKGFGSSGAQAWLAWLCACKLREGRYPVLSEEFFKTVLSSYQALFQGSKGYPPSGGDMVCQFAGKVTLMEKTQYTSHAWAFPSMGFVLVHTGGKVLTHTHLGQVDFEAKYFTALYEQGRRAFLAGEQSAFIEAFRAYQENLVARGLQVSSTTKLLASFSSVPGFIAGKGCGALGAEVVCVLYEKKYSQVFLDYLSSRFMVVATEQNLSRGLRYELLPGRPL